MLKTGRRVKYRGYRGTILTAYIPRGMRGRIMGPAIYTVALEVGRAKVMVRGGGRQFVLAYQRLMH